MNDRTQNLEGNVAQSYQALPDGNVAIIEGLSGSGSSRPRKFKVRIGVVRHYPGKHHPTKQHPAEDELQVDINSGFVNGFVVSSGKHEGWVRIKPVADDDRIIELSTQGDNGNVALESYIEKDEVLRGSIIPLDYFKREGFDLEQENPDNHGRVLNPRLSQMLYDFQLGQGQFQLPQRGLDLSNLTKVHFLHGGSVTVRKDGAQGGTEIGLGVAQFLAIIPDDGISIDVLMRMYNTKFSSDWDVSLAENVMGELVFCGLAREVSSGLYVRTEAANQATYDAIQNTEFSCGK